MSSWTLLPRTPCPCVKYPKRVRDTQYTGALKTITPSPIFTVVKYFDNLKEQGRCGKESAISGF